MCFYSPESLCNFRWQEDFNRISTSYGEKICTESRLFEPRLCTYPLQLGWLLWAVKYIDRHGSFSLALSMVCISPLITDRFQIITQWHSNYLTNWPLWWKREIFGFILNCGLGCHMDIPVTYQLSLYCPHFGVQSS